MTKQNKVEILHFVMINFNKIYKIIYWKYFILYIITNANLRKIVMLSI